MPGSFTAVTICLCVCWRSVSAATTSGAGVTNLNSTAAAEIATATPASTTVNTKSSPCHLDLLSASADETRRRVTAVLEQGGKYSVETLVFVIRIENISSEELQKSIPGIYKPFEWRRVYSVHGRNMLSLPFNYDFYSLGALGFKKDRVEVEATAHPVGCFHGLTPEGKIEQLQKLIMTKFDRHSNTIWVSGEEYVCHEEITSDNNKTAKFVDKCCHLVSDHIVCKTIYPNKYLKLLLAFVQVIAYAFYFFGPLLISNLFLKGSSRIAHYVTAIPQFLSFKMKDENSNSDSGDSKAVVAGRPTMDVGTRSLMLNGGNLKSGTTYLARVSNIKFKVDENLLMDENRVDVGLFSFLFQGLFGCRIAHMAGLRESARNKEHHEHHAIPCHCLRCHTWVLRTITIVLTFLFALLPLWIRMFIYYHLEGEEILLREDAVEHLHLHVEDHPFFPENPFTTLSVVMICLFTLSFVILGSMYLLSNTRANVDMLDSLKLYLYRIFHDFKQVRQTETLRLMIWYLYLPFHWFGFLGFILSAFLWPILFVLWIIQMVYYCLPTIYLLVNLLVAPFQDRFGNFQKKLFFFKGLLTKCRIYEKKVMKPIHTKDEKTNLIWTEAASGAVTFTKVTDKEFYKSDHRHGKKHRPTGEGEENALSETAKLSTSRELDAKFLKDSKANENILVNILISLSLVFLLFSLLYFWAWLVFYVAQVVVLTGIGILVNSKHASAYFSLALYVSLYAQTCFSGMRTKYKNLATKLFSEIKSKAGDTITPYVKLKEVDQPRVAVRFFKPQDIAESYVLADDTATPPTATGSSDEEREKYEDSLNRYMYLLGSDLSRAFKDKFKVYTRDDTEQYKLTCMSVIENNSICRFRVPEKKVDRLFTKKSDKGSTDKGNAKMWIRTRAMVMFLDERDVARIPQQLFKKLCNIDSPGFPGPIHQNIIIAFKELSYMLFTFLFVLVVILAFSEQTGMLRSNELLLTVVSGLLPLVFRMILMKSINKPFTLDPYVITGRVHNIIAEYKQDWPVTGMVFEKISGSAQCQKFHFSTKAAGNDDIENYENQTITADGMEIQEAWKHTGTGSQVGVGNEAGAGSEAGGGNEAGAGRKKMVRSISYNHLCKFFDGKGRDIGETRDFMGDVPVALNELYNNEISQNLDQTVFSLTLPEISDDECEENKDDDDFYLSKNPEQDEDKHNETY